MFKKLFNYYFPRHHSGAREINKAPVIVTYALIGLFAFGHNYANFPVMDESYNRENPPQLNQFLTGLKAICAGVGWPAYAMVLVNEELK